MSVLDGETKRKLREMNAGELVEAIDLQDDTLSISLSFEERVRLVVDDAYSTFMHSKVDGLIRRAGLRYPNADLRRIDLLDERGLNRQLLTQLGTCLFVTRQQNVVFQGFTGSGKSYLGCAIAKRACEHRIRALIMFGCPTSKRPGSQLKTPRRRRQVPPEIRCLHPARHRRVVT
ncbi:insertion sequence IS408 putative ATP-binding protein [Arthrobacter sp. Hiyo4]|nr:insertion sequence IS408 putative ATP-binding protein [Arthrobacter sp. Hiyo4]